MAGTVEEKARGAFFTPAPIADYMARWAIRSIEDRVLEPSCGDAVFLSAASSRLNEFDTGLAPSGMHLFGVEIHRQSAERASRRLREAGAAAQIQVGDFFDYEPPSDFDVVLGNPPFIRYQDFTGSARARSLEFALAQGVRLSGLASSWAAFVIKAASHLTANGRMALVLPAELLSVGYAAEVRRFLLRRFARLKLIAFEERVFPGVLEDVVLLLAEGEGGAKCFELHQARNAASLASDDQVWTQHAPVGGDKWTAAFVAQGAFAAYDELGALSCERLGDWGNTYLGSVTGNNSFFSLTAQEAHGLEVRQDELLKISPPGTRHLRGLEISSKSWDKLLRDGARCYLFYPGDNPSDGAVRYIETGELRSVSKAYKCRVRRPWWRVPLVDTPDLLLTYMNHDRPRLITNSAKVSILNSLYGVRLTEDRKRCGRSLLPIACLNSVTLLGAEVVGRAYGGGLLKLEPREADQLPVPSLRVLSENSEALLAIKPQLGTALRNGKLEDACKLVDPIIFPDASQETLTALRQARELLFQRRKTRAGNG